MQSETTRRTMDFDGIMIWLHAHRKQVGIIAGITVVAAIVIALYVWNQNRKEAAANSALFALPSALGPTRRAGEVRADSYGKVASQYSGTKAGERAELLAAGFLFTEGKYADAHQMFVKFLESHSDSELRSQAALGIAASLEAQGKTSEAITQYQSVISQYSEGNTVSPAKLTLARLFENQNKPVDALKLYDDLGRSRNPYDPWTAEAGERREILLEKHPELKNRPTTSSALMTSTNANVISAPTSGATNSATKK